MSGARQRADLWAICGPDWITSHIGAYRGEQIFDFLCAMGELNHWCKPMVRDRRGVPMLTDDQRKIWRTWQRKGFSCERVVVAELGPWA